MEKTKQKRLNNMELIPFRIIEFEGEIKPGVDIPKCFDFMILGSKGILSPPYKIIIHIDELNTGEVIYTKCPCDDCFWKRNENCKRFVSKDYKCKHIKESELILIEYKELSSCKHKANYLNKQEDKK